VLELQLKLVVAGSSSRREAGATGQLQKFLV
jgi:hypothetical protein